MILKTILIPLIAVTLIGCATSQNMNKISLGMSKPEVVRALGEPGSTSANQSVEYLIYVFDEEGTGWSTRYFVKLTDGHVVSYGRVGDFDSTKPFESKHEIDVNVKEK